MLKAAADPKTNGADRVALWGEAAKMQGGVIVEETIVRPLMEAPARAREMGVHIEQAARATSATEKAIHALEAVKAGTDAFTGLAGPAALTTSGITPATAGARAEALAASRGLATRQAVVRAGEAAEAGEISSQIGRGQQILREGEGTFVRGGQGEFVYAEGTLGETAAPRDLSAQSALPGKLPGDQAGHALAARFGFSGKEANLVPMAPQLNLSAYKKLENHLARLQAQGHEVMLEVWGVPGQNPQRPDRFFVVYSVDGRPASATFENPLPKAK